MTLDNLKIAQHHLLSPADLDAQKLERVLDHLLISGVDDADIYLQSSQSESWVLEDGIIKEGSYGHDQGAGLRAVSGEKTGLAYCDTLDFKLFMEAAGNARSIVKGGASGRTPVKPNTFKHHYEHPLYLPDSPLSGMDTEGKIGLMRTLDTMARAMDPRIEQVIVSLAGSCHWIAVMGIDGMLRADIRPLVRLNITVIAHQDGRREQGSAGGGGRVGYHWFLHENRGQQYVEEAVRQALINLEAADAPAGLMTVVLGSGWPGILLHEAIGHGLEGDFNRKGTSAFSGMMGERVASSLCTIVDDGTLPERRGSLSMDDEGTTTENTVLIENGILRSYMQDRQNARLMGVPVTGNGRRESYQHLPMPRMTNTYMLPGEHDPDEIIASVKYGLYARNFGGGQVDITSGKFVFSASEAYLIENGKLSHPVKGATLIGNGPEVLTMVSMVGNDLALDTGVGTCGKDGQSVPVGVGQPTLKVESMTVGGTRVG